MVRTQLLWEHDRHLSKVSYPRYDSHQLSEWCQLNPEEAAVITILRQELVQRSRNHRS